MSGSNIVSVGEGELDGKVAIVTGGGGGIGAIFGRELAVLWGVGCPGRSGRGSGSNGR